MATRKACKLVELDVIIFQLVREAVRVGVVLGGLHVGAQRQLTSPLLTLVVLLLATLLTLQHVKQAVTQTHVADQLSATIRSNRP